MISWAASGVASFCSSGVRLARTPARDQLDTLGRVERLAGRRVDLVLAEDRDPAEGGVVRDRGRRAVREHPGRRVEQRLAARGVDRDPAVLLDEGPDVDLLGQAPDQRVAAVEQLGAVLAEVRQTLDLGIQVVDRLELGVDLVHRLADLLIGLAAQHLHLLGQLAERWR